MSATPGREDPERDALARRLSDAAATIAPGEAGTPLMLVDLDAYDANAADLVRRAGGTPVRLASKSVRVPALVDRAMAAGFRGLLAYQLREALWHAERGVDDVLMGYPTVDRAALARLTGDLRERVTLMVDSPAHLDVVAAATTDPDGVRICLDVDAGLQLPRGGHVGPKRSPLREPEQVAALAREAVRRGFRVRGVMTYEGQVAGLQDRVPTDRARSLAIRGIKAASVRQLRRRRADVARALADVVDLELWNAGGSGSVETSAADPVVTEVAAGSGLLVPGLFDHYRSFAPRPAAYFGVPVVRRPGPGVATVGGGGLIASGAAGPDRLPLPWAPSALRLTALEGAGEVQTPLVGPGADALAVGDLVWFRHAKAGEPAEHTDRVHLVRGDRVVGCVPTYRGLGLTW